MKSGSYVLTGAALLALLYGCHAGKKEPVPETKPQIQQVRAPEPKFPKTSFLKTKVSEFDEYSKIEGLVPEGCSIAKISASGELSNFCNGNVRYTIEIKDQKGHVVRKLMMVDSHLKGT